MADALIRMFTKADRLRGLRASLKNPDGSAVDFSTGSTDGHQGVYFRMIRSSDGTDHVTGSTSGIAIISSTGGTVRYDWTSSAIGTAGDYYAWFVRYLTTSTGFYEHFPAGRGLMIRIHTDT